MTFSAIRCSRFSQLINFCLIITFVVSLLITPRASYAQVGVIDLPQPGTMVSLSSTYAPAVLHGVIIDPKDPLRFDFIVDPGNSGLSGPQLTEETTKLAKYFLAGIAIPDEDLWVNLSPFEKNRIIPENFGFTDMGRDLLSEDYILKQLTASIIYPERAMGKKFWDEVYLKARQKYGTANVPVNTFNKVWVVPEKAVVYQNGNKAFIAESRLKVMLEEDFLALSKHQSQPASTHTIASQVVRDIVLPLLEKEINTGKNFAQLRQVYSAVILANWFKRALKESLVNQVYANSKKVNGIDIADKGSKLKIYQQYLQAYKKGVFNYIKEEYDPAIQNTVPRKYFSGGANFNLDIGHAARVIEDPLYLTVDQKHYVLASGQRTNAMLVSYKLETVNAAQKVDAASNTVDAASISTDKSGFDHQYYNHLLSTVPDLQAEVLQQLNHGQTLATRTTIQIQKDIELADALKKQDYDHIVFETNHNPVLAEVYLHYLTGRRDYNEALPPGRAQIHFATGQTVQAVSSELRSTGKKVNIVILDDVNDLGVTIAEYIKEGAAQQLYEGSRSALFDGNVQSEAYQFAAQQLAYAKNGHQTLVFSVVGELMERFGVWMSGTFNRELGDSNSNAITVGEWISEHLHATGQATQSEAKIVPAFIRMDTGRGNEVAITNTLNHDIEGYKYNTVMEIAARSIEAAIKEQGRESQRFDLDVTTLAKLGQTVEMMEMSARMAGLMAGRASRDQARGLKEKVEEKLQEIPGNIALPSGQSVLTQNILNVETKAGGELELSGAIVQQALGHGIDRSRILEHAAKVLGYLINKKSGGIAKTVDSIGAANDLVHLNPNYTREGLDLTEAMAREFKKYKKVYVAAIGGSLTGDYLKRELNLKEGPEVVFLTDLDPVRAELIDEEIKKDPDGTAIIILSKSGNTLETDVAGGFLRTSLKEAFHGRENLNDLLAEHTLALTDAGRASNMRREVQAEGLRSLPHPPHGGRFSMFSSLGLFFYFLNGGKREGLEKALTAWEEQNNTLGALVSDLKQYSDAITSKDPERFSEQDKLAAVKNVLEIMQRYPGILFGFLMTFINTLDQVDPQLKKNVHVALSMDEVMGQMVNPKTPLMQQLFVESLAKPGTDDYTIPVAGWASILEQWNRIVSHPHTFASLWLQRTNTNEGRRAYAENQVLRDEMTKAGMPFLSYETGQMDVMNLANMMRMIYMWLEISAQAYGDKIPVSSMGQDGVEKYKEKMRITLEVMNQKIAEEVDQAADQLSLSPEARLTYVRTETLRKRGEVTVESIPKINWDEQKGSRFNLDDFAMTSDEEMAAVKTFFNHFIGGDAFPNGLVTQEVRDALEFDRPHQIPEFLKGRMMGLVKSLAGERLSQLVLDGETVENGNGDWVIVADSVDYPQNILNNKAYGSSLAIFKKNAQGGFQQEDMIASFFVQWGSKPTVVFTLNGKTRRAELLDDGSLRVINPGTEDQTVQLAIRGKYAAIGGNSQEWPEGFMAFRQEHEGPAEKWTTRYAGETLATNLNLMLGKDGIVIDWMTWPQALMVSQTVESSNGVSMVMTPQGLRHIHELTVSEDQFKSGERVFVYAGPMNLVNMIQVWMNFLNVRDRNDFQNAPIIKTLDLLKNLPDDSPDTLKAAALMFLLRLQTSLSFFHANDQLKGDVKNIIAQLRTTIQDLLQNKFKSDTIQATMEGQFEKDIKLNDDEWKDKKAQYVLFGDPQSKIGASLTTAQGNQRLSQLQYDYNAITSWDLIDQLRSQIKGHGLTDSLGVLDEQIGVLSDSYTKNAQPLIKPREKIVIPDLPLGENVEDYLQENVQMPQGNDLEPNVAEATRQQMFKAAGIIKGALVAPTRFKVQDLHPIQREEYSKLRKKEPSIFKDIPGGEVEILSLRDVMRTLRGQKGGHVNTSGDVADRLDHIFNIIFNNELRPHVHYIISEENDEIVLGIDFGGEREQRAYLEVTVFSDPIDGSSGIPENAPFGAIFGFGYLNPGQQINDGTFDPRKQFVFGMDFRFGPSTKMTIVNPNGKIGVLENVQFTITRELDFKKEWTMKNQLDLELENLDWDGLRPQPNGHPIFLAQGGNLSESLEDGHAQIYKFWEREYGVVSGYAGALNTDVSQAFTIGLFDPKIPGKGYMYPATKSKPFGRLRVWFEALFMGHYLRNIGAEATDGLEPIFNRKLQGEEPSKDQTPLYALSTWMSKMVVSWKQWVKDYSIQGLKVDSKDGDAKFRDFLKFYDGNSKRLLQEVVAFSNKNSTPKSEEQVRRALLMWDAKSVRFVDLLRMTGENAYQQLFPDRAQATASNRVGGIFLGTGNYLNVVNYSPAGMPVFDAQQIRHFKIGFNGFVPVPLNTDPQPVDLSSLSGLQ